ncbi:MAG: fumarylacetoacetate hydrolase family protein [Rhizobiaceae bacterium]
MRLATFTHDNRQYWGAVAEGGVIALSPDFPQWRTLRNVIEADALVQVGEAAAGRDITWHDGSFTWDIPVPDPEKIICVGVNYPERNAEYDDGQAAPSNMSLFVRFPRTFVGHLTALTRPPETPQLDYEGEVAIVIGKGGRRIAESEALGHIAALTICNEGTLRDWVRHAKFNVTQGKNWERSGSMGPWLVPVREPGQVSDIRLQTRVNGETRQDDRTSRMVFPIARQIAYISTFTTLVPGDIIITGTPTGAGARFDPPRFLVPGDVVEVEVESVGILRNGVVDE